jgi:hypothetical protein
MVLCASLLSEACTKRDIVAVEVGVVTAHPSIASLLDGQVLQFTAIVTDIEGRPLPGATVTWETEDPDIVSIDATGILRALREGEAIVRATFRGVSGTSVVTVLPDAVLEASDDSVVFHAAVGQPSPAPAVLELSLTGVGRIGGLEASIDFAAGQPDGWLTPALADTVAPTSLTLAPSTSALPAGAYDATLVIESSDDDGPLQLPVSLRITGLTVSESGGSSSVSESGREDTVTVVLDAPPLADVVVDVASGDPTEVVVSPVRLTFTPSTWDVPQTVALIGVDDEAVDGDRVSTVTVSVVDALSDPAFSPVPDREITVTTVDDDKGRFSAHETDGATRVGEGGTDDVMVVLDLPPLSNVVIRVTSVDPTQLTVSPGVLTFTPQSWATPQTVVVTGVQDGVPEGLQTIDVVFAVDAARSDDGFDGAPDRVITASVFDGLTVVQTGGSTRVTESGGRDSVTVALGARPSSDVSVQITRSDPTEVRLTPESLKFTPSSWNVPQTVVVRPEDDVTVDGDVTSEIVFSVAGNSDPVFLSVPARSVLVTTVDDEVAGFTIDESGDWTTVRERSSDDLKIVLDAQPLSTVVITLTSADPNYVFVAPASLIFTSQNWSRAQEVEVFGVDNNRYDGFLWIDVTVSVDDANSDDAFDAVADQVLRVLFRD